MSALAPKADIERSVMPNFLEWKRNNSIYRCDPQTEGISLPRSNLFEKARSNLVLASS